MGTYEKRGVRSETRDGVKARTYRGSPLSDRLVRALFEHHRDLTPPELECRLLPMCVRQPNDVVAIRRNVFKYRPPTKVICLPDLSDKPLPETPRASRRSASLIIRGILREHNIDLAVFVGPSRTHDLVRVRREICYRIATETDLSWMDIGRMLKKDHTTVINAVMRWCADHALPLPRGATWKRKIK